MEVPLLRNEGRHRPRPSVSVLNYAHIRRRLWTGRARTEVVVKANAAAERFVRLISVPVNFNSYGSSLPLAPTACFARPQTRPPSFRDAPSLCAAAAVGGGGGGVNRQLAWNGCSVVSRLVSNRASAILPQF